MQRRSTEARESAEARLLLACARFTLDAHHRERALEALRHELDWVRVFRMADEHGLLPLLHRNLGALPPGAVPKEVLVELWGRHEATASRNRTMARELLALLALFDAHGIEALAYKGPALAEFLYGDVALREFGDLDILMRPRDVLRAKALLKVRGYASDYPLEPAVEGALLRSGSQYHLAMTHEEHGLVELHWKTDPDSPVERIDDDAWWASLPRARLGERSIRSFTREELLLVLVVHGTKHHWECAGWLVDVAELVGRESAMNWRWVCESAARVGCERRVALTLYLAQDLLEAPLPAAALAVLDAHPEVAAVGDRIALRLFDPQWRDLRPLEALGMNLGLYERTAERLRHGINTVFAPSLVEWSRWPLPRALFFLYPALRLMRLTRKYLLR